MVDHFVFCGRYQFGQPGDYPPGRMLGEMAREGVSKSFASPLEALFSKDASRVNGLFLARCERLGDRVSPVPVLDLSTGTGPAEIAGRLAGKRVRAVRLAPNYHGYGLGDGLVAEFLEAAARAGLAVFIARHAEDPRFQSPCLSAVEPLELAALLELAGRAGEVEFVFNKFASSEIAALASVPANVRFDISAFDGSFGSMEECLSRHGPGPFVYGSGRPFLCPGAVLHNLERGFAAPETVRRVLGNTLANARVNRRALR